MLGSDADYFQELQTQTGWGRTLYGFALWCSPESGWRTLDVGCGPGLLPAIFSQLGCRSTGVDLDIEMFKPTPLYSQIAVADVISLPFPSHTFDLVTASNLLFLLPDPLQALRAMTRLVWPEGRLAMLNPSELLTEQAAATYAIETGLEGMARDTLLNWARRACDHHRWTEDETSALYVMAGMKYLGSALKVGPGFGRVSIGTL